MHSQTYALCALLHLAAGGAGHAALMARADIIAPAVHLTRPAAAGDVRALAASLIARLASDVDARPAVVGAGAVPACVHLIQSGGRDAGGHAAAALLHLCTAEPALAAVLLRSGVLDAAADALRRGPPARAVAKLLAHLCASAPGALEEAAAAGVLSGLVSAVAAGARPPAPAPPVLAEGGEGGGGAAAAAAGAPAVAGIEARAHAAALLARALVTPATAPAVLAAAEGQPLAAGLVALLSGAQQPPAAAAALAALAAASPGAARDALHAAALLLWLEGARVDPRAAWDGRCRRGRGATGEGGR